MKFFPVSEKFIIVIKTNTALKTVIGSWWFQGCALIRTVSLTINSFLKFLPANCDVILKSILFPTEQQINFGLRIYIVSFSDEIKTTYVTGFSVVSKATFNVDLIQLCKIS